MLQRGQCGGQVTDTHIICAAASIQSPSPLIPLSLLRFGHLPLSPAVLGSGGEKISGAIALPLTVSESPPLFVAQPNALSLAVFSNSVFS